MSNRSQKAVKLKKANRYNTYQFYAEMNNKNISLNDGLKIAALSCFHWLRNRLEQNEIPQELNMPEAKDYKKVSDDSFGSFTIHDSYQIIVESCLQEGIWSLRVIENDSGSLNEEIVPGRTIQSDLAFRIAGNRLECGFKTIINDLKQVEQAKCIRYSLVKELGCNLAFGFKQVNTLYNPNNMVIDHENKLEEIYEILYSKENQLPIIIYTYDDNSVSNIQDIKVENLSSNSISSIIRNPKVSINVEPKRKEEITEKAVPYSNRYLGYARPYFLPKKLFISFQKKFVLAEVHVDDVFVLEPITHQISRYSYKNKEKYQEKVFQYTRNKELDFHDVLFIDEAKVIIQAARDIEKKEKDKLLDQKNDELEKVKNQQARETRLAEYNSSDSSKNDLEDAFNKLEKMKNENDILSQEISRLRKELVSKNKYIDYIHRKEKYPKNHKEIAKWASSFSHIILDKKAVSCLERNDATYVECEVICDALDYLEEAYSKYLFENLSLDDLNEISSNIYNRPYNVSPSGIPISAKGDCKVKYAYMNEKRCEHILDQHLKIGAHGDLLRIYFIIDKDRKKIVIGSLPNHLEY